MQPILRRYLTRAEEKQFFDAIKARSGFAAARDYHVLRLIRLCGGRVGAICKLTVGDARNALAEQSLQFRSAIAKGGRGYEVPLTKAITEELRALLKLRKDEGLSMDLAEPLVISRTRGKGGTGLTPRALQMRCRHWSQAAGLSVEVSPHWLRHTLGQRLVECSTGKEPVLHAAAVLGHRDLRSTMIYTRPTREAVASSLREAAL